MKIDAFSSPRNFYTPKSNKVTKNVKKALKFTKNGHILAGNQQMLKIISKS